MSVLTPGEAARWATRAGLSLPDDRHALVAATADQVHSVVSVLRELDFGNTAPFREGDTDATA
ncbi:hypothetical protein SAMN05216188_110195 [Lentzea xinjiangensis]|uniref:Amidase n=1 Tax=Lentzea xinjiangensis TaxID=402600 RepID=A0A1H9NHQ2_9PSEU|nr:hypothetical protein [Lentzea xinjiangensis]SER34913.1 hypothetical protein SAMN05216188_110195 [Lentzea xinjiangensis]